MQTRLNYSSSRYDASLMPTMAFDSHFLVLEYRIRLVRCEPTTRRPPIDTVRFRGDGILRDGASRFNLDAWTNAEWDGFSKNFPRIIMDYWDDKLELTPSRAWFRASSQHKLAEHRVKCRLNVTVVNSAARAHQTYYIIKPRQTNFRSFVWLDERLGVFTHRDLSKSQAIRQTRIGPPAANGQQTVHNIAFEQTTILHEFGHTLGLDHVRGRGNDDHHYGVTRADRDDVMGMGEHMTEAVAQPWISQMRRHLIPEHADRAAGVSRLSFTGRVTAKQRISYWDNNISNAANVRARSQIEYPKVDI